MKQMFTPEDFVSEINRLAESKQDYVATTDCIRFHTDETGSRLDIDGMGERAEKLPINDVAHAQIATRLGIPKAYYDRLRAEQHALLDANVGTWLNAPVERRLVRTLDGKVRAFLSDRYQRIDNIDIVRAIAEPLGRVRSEHGAYVESSAITDTKMYIKVVVPGVEAQIERGNHTFLPDGGDIVQAGFVISNSETGHGSFSVQQMVYRLVCKNGLIRGESLSKRHIGGRIAESDVFSDRTRKLDDETILSAARDLIEAAVDETRFRAIVAQMGEAAQTPDSVNPVSTVEALAKTHGFSDAEAGHVLSAFVSDAPLNGLGLFGVVNAVTRASQEVEDYERATELEKLGGVLLDTKSADWLKLAGVVS